MTTTLAERFWARVDQRDPDGCWPWTGARDPKGYGRCWNGHRTVTAHRLAYELTNGPVAPGSDVCHRCDNRPCCRPAHLFEGTRADNLADMRGKRRGSPPPRGLAWTNRSPKLSREDVVKIRRAIAAGVTQRELCRRFDVAPATMSRAVTGHRAPKGLVE